MLLKKVFISEIEYLYSINNDLRFCKKIISRYIVFKKTKSGRLYRKNTGENIITIKNHINYVSFSYSDAYITICTSNSKIGVDIEKIVSKVPINIINNNLEIKKYLQNQEFKEKSFTRLWTLEEAYCKYKGTGLKNIFQEKYPKYMRSILLDEYWISYISKKNISIYFSN